MSYKTNKYPLKSEKSGRTLFSLSDRLNDYLFTEKSIDEKIEDNLSYGQNINGGKLSKRLFRTIDENSKLVQEIKRLMSSKNILKEEIKESALPRDKENSFYEETIE